MSGERTEEPTPKKLGDARAKGEVPRSRDLVSFASLVGASAVGVLTSEASIGRLRGLVVRSVRMVADPMRISPGAALLDAATTTLAVSGPILVGALVVGTTVAFVDAGPVFAPGKLLPDASRLDPAKGASQLFGRDRLVELGKSLLVLVAFTALTYGLVRDLAPAIARLPGHGAVATLALAGESVSRLLVRVLAVLALVAGLDVVLSRRSFTRAQRMTKDEVRREAKESEGDPHLRGERMRMHREILEHSVLENVRRADVLVVNPTHLAIALRFDVDSDQDAPEITGKGEDELAAKMIAVALEAGVPVMRDIPLARSLYELSVGEEIPEPLFEAVAAVLRAAWAERDAT